MITHALDACPGCRGTDARALTLGSHDGLLQCATCDLVYAREYADPDEIYVEGYLTGKTDFGLDIFDPLFQEFLYYAAGHRLDVLEPLVARGSLLDVGCGSGEVLDVAKRRGWTVAGAEPVAESAEIARSRGLDVRTSLLADAGFERGSFDVVSAFHVLEHMSDGAAFLREISQWARPGGHVLIEVPNWTSHHRERTNERWPNLRPLEHVAHYGPDTLRRTFEAAGLQPVEIQTMGFLWSKQSVDEQLADLAHGRWAPALRRIARRHRRPTDGAPVPGALMHRALRGVEARYDRAGKGQVVIGLARVDP